VSFYHHILWITIPLSYYSLWWNITFDKMVHIFGSQWRSCLTSTSIAPTMKHSAWPLCRRYLGGSGTVVMYDFCSSCFVHAVNLYFYMYINCSLQPICLFLHNLDIYPSLITCSRHSFAVDSIWHLCKADRKSPEATFPQQRQGPAKHLLQIDIVNAYQKSSGARVLTTWQTSGRQAMVNAMSS